MILHPVLSLIFSNEFPLGPRMSPWERQGQCKCGVAELFETRTTEHQLSCIVLKKFIPELENTSIVYEDIYSNVNKQLAAVKLFVKIFKQKEIILEAMGK